MKNARPTPPDARVLRQQAERKLREQPPLAEQPASEIDARTLVHELQVRQIELEMQNEDLHRTQAQAQAALDKYTELFDFAPLGYFQLTQDGAVREANLAGAAMLGLDRSLVVSRRFGVWVALACRETFANFCETVLASDTKQTCEIQLLCQGRGAQEVQLEGLAAPDQTGLEKTWRLAVLDVTPRKQAEAALRESDVRYRTLFNTIDAGFCIIEMIFDAQGKPADYRFLEVNAAFEKQTGLHEARGKLMRELAPGHEPHWFEVYGKIALTGEPQHFVNEARALNRWYDVYAYRVGAPESRQVAILFNDITVHKQAETEIRRRAEELVAANDELTRFNRVTLGRELRIIELKKQVNELRAQLGQPPRYQTDLDEKARPTP
jgi:PAS domain S-box-containing protein